MRVLVTGASGLLGAAVVRAARARHHRVLAWGGRFRPEPEDAEVETGQVDLADEAAVTAAVLEQWPEAVVHAAAVTENSACEADPVRAAATIVAASRRLAELSHHLGFRLVHVSTDQVFGGDAAPYLPTASPAPRLLYGRLKAEAEEAVRSAAPETASVLRLPLLQGDSPSGTRSVHERLFAAWSRGERPRLFSDEVRQPCHADDAAGVAIELLERSDAAGVHHWAGAEAVSRAEIGRRLLAHFGLPADWMVEVRAADDPRLADRPRDLRLALGPVAHRLRHRPETLEAQMHRLRVPGPVRAWWASLGPRAAPP